MMPSLAKSKNSASSASLEQQQLQQKQQKRLREKAVVDNGKVDTGEPTSNDGNDEEEEEEDDLPLLLSAQTSTPTTGTSIAGGGEEDEERWLELELELLERMSVRTQTVEEILAEKNDFPLEEDDEDFLLLTNRSAPPGEDGDSSAVAAATATGGGLQLPSTIGRSGTQPQQQQLSNSYQLDSPLLLRKEDAIPNKVDGGQPTAICVGPQLLALGTSQGNVLVFQQQQQKGDDNPADQKLLHFGHPGGDSALGSVACLDLSPDQSRLCAGYSMGALLVFGLQPQQQKGGGGSGGAVNPAKILFKSTDVVQPGRGILHVKYISNHALLLLDNGGNVYEFHERRRRLVGGGGQMRQQKDSVRCLFTGCKGEVTNIAFVQTASVELLVLATFHQVLLLSVKNRSRGATVGQLRLHGSPLWPPLLDWRERTVRATSRASASDLRLCIAREREARIYQIRQRVGGDLLFPLVQILRFGCPLINLKWLEDWALLTVCIDSGAEQLQLIEFAPQQQQQLVGPGQEQQQQHKLSSSQQQQQQGSVVAPSAQLEISNQVQLVYNSADFKGMATGRNVSQAMQQMADSVCLQSVARHPAEDRVFLLGQQGIFCIQLMEQAEQLDLLVQRGDYVSALLFAVDICTGRVRDRTKHNNKEIESQHGVGSFRARAHREIPLLVESLLVQTLADGPDSGLVDDLIAYYKRNFYVLMRACVLTSHFELLYNTVYNGAYRQHRSIFMELLEEFVLEGQLYMPPPVLVNDYLNYLLAEGQLPQFEQSITKLPVECMDLNLVMTACKEHQLLDGICYVLNNAMRDYISPLQEMFDQVQRFVPKAVLSDLEIAQGNKLLLYLSCCLAGRAYPYGELPDEHFAQTVPLETYKFLVQLRPNFTIAATPSPSPSSPTTTTMDLDGGGQEGDGSTSPADPAAKTTNGVGKKQGTTNTHRRFPHLNILLRFDAPQFLNMISTCADAPVFAQCEGRLKRLVDMLVSMFVEEVGAVEEENNEETKDARTRTMPEPIIGTSEEATNDGDGGLRNEELGPLLATFVGGLLQRGAIPRDVFLLTQLIQRILQQHRWLPNVRAQKAVVELLRVVPEVELDPVLEMALKLPHVHVCAYIFTVRKDYVRLLECCLQDPVEPLNIFPILGDLLASLRLSDQRDGLAHFVRHHLTPLCALDAAQTAQLVLAHFPEFLVESRHRPSRQLPLALVRHCFRLRREQGYRTLTGGEEEQDEQLFDFFFEGSIEEAAAAAQQQNGPSPSSFTSISTSSPCWSRLDMELADQLRYWLPLGALTDHCLNVAMQQPTAQLLECGAILLVARGHIGRAFALLDEGIQQMNVATAAGGGGGQSKTSTTTTTGGGNESNKDNNNKENADGNEELLLLPSFGEEDWEAENEDGQQQRQRQSIADSSSTIRLGRCVDALLELAVAHPAEAQAGQWLPKLFRHLLNSVAEQEKEQQSTEDNNKTKANGEVLHVQLLRPDSHLCRVFTAIMEQQQQQHNNKQRLLGSADDQQQKMASEEGEAEEDEVLPIVSLVGELFTHPVFRNAPFHAFQSLLRQMLLWCEIRALMQRCTRDCVGWEFADRWTKVACRKAAFASTAASSISADPMASASAAAARSSVPPPAFQQQQMCRACGHRITKSFFLFPCGHCLHLECDHEREKDTAAAAAARGGREKRCPCQQQQQQQPQQQQLESQDTASSKNSIIDFVENSDSLSAAAVANSDDNKMDYKEALEHHKQPPKEEERRVVSTIFRNLEQDFRLRTGPPPPPPSSRGQLQLQQQQQMPKRKILAPSPI